MLFRWDMDCWKWRHLDHSVRITIISWSWSIVWNWCFRMWDLISILWSEGGTIGSPPYPAIIELYLAHVTRSRYMSLWKSKGALGNPPIVGWINSGVGSRITMFIRNLAHPRRFFFLECCGMLSVGSIDGTSQIQADGRVDLLVGHPWTIMIRTNLFQPSWGTPQNKGG